jgi:hypothetical protein
MKKVLSTIAAVLAAVSFAALVSAADMPAEQSTSPSATTTTVDQGAPVKKVKKHHKKSKKHRRHAKHKKMVNKPAAAPAGSSATEPPAPPTPAN